MSIDDPIKAAEALIASDERQRSVVTERIADAVATLGLSGADKVAGFLQARRAENRDLLIKVLRDELQRLIHNFDKLSSTHQSFIMSPYGLLPKGERFTR